MHLVSEASVHRIIDEREAKAQKRRERKANSARQYVPYPAALLRLVFSLTCLYIDENASNFGSYVSSRASRDPMNASDSS